MTKINELKKENIQKIRKCFYEGGIWTKNELSEKTGLSLAGTTNVLQYLHGNQEIVLSGKADSTGGRKSKQYELNASFSSMGLLILMRLKDGYAIDVSIRDLGGKQQYHEVLRDDKGDLKFVDLAIRTLLKHGENVSMLSISIPGVCKDGVVDVCDFEALENTEIGKHIETEFGISYCVENDVNIACIGFAKDYPDHQDIAFIYQSQMYYSGCGILVHRRLYNGYTHAAGELRFLQDALQLDADAKELLKIQMMAICSVMNPSLIGYHSDYGYTDIQLDERQYPSKHAPQIVPVEDLHQMIETGLFEIGMHNILKERESV